MLYQAIPFAVIFILLILNIVRKRTWMCLSSFVYLYLTFCFGGAIFVHLSPRTGVPFCLKGERRVFDLPIRLRGTDFQQKVWTALLDIPYGEIRSYKQIAEAIGIPKGMRAVGMANNRNPLLIVVPCHRVIGANGSMVGYGEGVEMKEFLLRLEKSLP